MGSWVGGRERGGGTKKAEEVALVDSAESTEETEGGDCEGLTHNSEGENDGPCPVPSGRGEPFPEKADKEGIA